MILPIEKDSRGKWMPNWKGPYVVTKAFSEEALILAEIDGKEFQNPVNPDSVKKIAGLVSSWPSSVDRVKTFIFPASRRGECQVILVETVSSKPSSVDRVKTFIFPTSRMEECRVISAEHDNLPTFSYLQDRSRKTR
ncbi:hypothetical protein V6N12_008080 [Hibiscus sabdariffa]|uniref:Uncharacterized protein n=1 Tax=Hibiscus sabdariffa TaxID=183260 RepID=A0ABR2BT44_9ROSI